MLKQSFKELFKNTVNRFRQQKLLFKCFMDRYSKAESNKEEMSIYNIERSYESGLLDKLRSYCRDLFREYLDNILQFEIKEQFNFAEEPWWNDDIA